MYYAKQPTKSWYERVVYDDEVLGALLASPFLVLLQETVSLSLISS